METVGMFGVAERKFGCTTGFRHRRMSATQGLERSKRGINGFALSGDKLCSFLVALYNVAEFGIGMFTVP